MAISCKGQVGVGVGLMSVGGAPCRQGGAPVELGWGPLRVWVKSLDASLGSLGGLKVPCAPR